MTQESDTVLPTIDRRRFLLTSLDGAVAAPLAAETQQPRPVRIGWLSIAPHPFITAFRAGLRELGYLEGQGLIITEQYAEGQPDRLLGLARELIAQRVDIFVTSGEPAARAAN